MRSLTPAVRAVLVDIRTSPRTALRREPTSVRLACMAGLAYRGRDGPALTALGAFALRTGSVPSEPEEVSALTEILLQGPSGADPEAVGSGMPPDWMVRDEDPSPIPDARPCPFCGSRRVTLQVYDDEWCWIPDDAVRDLLGIYDDRPVTPTERRIAYDGYEGLGYIWCAECQGCGAQVHADSWRGALDAWERRA